MAHAAALPRGHASPVPLAIAETARIPWYIWCCLLATTSATIGGVWDISWHESIGRDSFWTPAHMMIYLCGVLAGIACGFLILATSFNPRSPLRDSSVRMWGFRAPLGAFVAAWGGVAMLVSAPFDNWWHNAYGLDVKVLSPPHVVLILGILAIRYGTLLLILGAMNRTASDALRKRLDWLFLYVGCLLVGGIYSAFMEMTVRVFMHSARFYLITGLAVPIMLAPVARASIRRWAATISMGMLMAIACAFVWILPLFPAAPKLGPVYQAVTYFVAPEFPKLLIAGAILFDLLRSSAKSRGWGDWKLAVLGGAGFLAAFLLVQWPFADFLMSPASRNWFFATHLNFPYFTAPDSPYVHDQFVALEPTAAAFWKTMGFAFLASILSTRVGLAWGASLQRIKR